MIIFYFISVKLHTATAWSIFFGSSAHVWKRLPATLLATASEDIVLYSLWLTMRNHVPKRSARRCWVAVGRREIQLKREIIWCNILYHIQRWKYRFSVSITMYISHVIWAGCVVTVAILYLVFNNLKFPSVFGRVLNARGWTLAVSPAYIASMLTNHCSNPVKVT